MSTPLHLILLAGGQGLRAGNVGEGQAVPKQFRPTGRGPLFAVSLREFGQASQERAWHLASVTVTAPIAWQDVVTAELSLLSVPWQVALPGTSRTASTWNATVALAAAVKPGDDDLVAVHDAARPFATVALLNALAAVAIKNGGAIPGVPVTDTIVKVTDGAAAYLQRESLMGVQTPQVFRWSIFEPAHRWAHDAVAEFTDDGGLMAAKGHLPAVIPGETGNWKVTSTADWERAADILR